MQQDLADSQLIGHNETWCPTSTYYTAYSRDSGLNCLLTGFFLMLMRHPVTCTNYKGSQG